MTDNETEGTFVWINKALANFTSWRSGEPTALSASDEDCVHLFAKSKGDWNDLHCGMTTHMGSICESKKHC